jgi:hypothetical protein
MIKGEEKHVGWLETQLESIGQIGIENYLTQQVNNQGKYPLTVETIHAMLLAEGVKTCRQ